MSKIFFYDLCSGEISFPGFSKNQCSKDLQLLAFFYCANDILILIPPFVLVMGAEVEILGSVLR